MTFSFISKIYEKILKKHSLFNLPKKDVFIVMGESRGGTSLIMKFLKEAGIFVGQIKDLKKADPGNPEGYFEYKKEHKLSSLAQRTRNKKFQRIITKIKMNRFLVKIYNRAGDGWALKFHPFVFPLWQAYIPNFKLVLVYRHPVVVAHSNIKLKKFKMPFHEYILKWERSYREIIYYYGRYPSIVINYDDLVNPDKSEKVLQGLISFIGRGDIDNLKKVITPELNRSSEEMSKLIELYSLPQSTKEVLETLEKIKVS